MKLENLQPQIILNETEYGVLLGNVLSQFVYSRKQGSTGVQVQRTIFIPSLNNETLEVRATTNSKQQRYRTALLFDDVEFVDDPEPGERPDPNTVTIMGSDGSKYYLNKLLLNNIDVKVKCSCPDFYWRFATWNSGDESLIGKPPPPYIKKTNRPPVNPGRVPGVCKHIIKLADQLISKGLFK
jgi:hypothetical protein